MTFAELRALLARMNPDAALVFRIGETVLGAGYHVTELRHSTSTGIDCGGRVESWEEARLQLLDGPGKRHMSVGKFIGILDRSLSRLPKLADVPMLVEVSPGNRGLALMTMDGSAEAADRVTLHLRNKTAICKPWHRNRIAGALASASRDDATRPSACCEERRAQDPARACCG